MEFKWKPSALPWSKEHSYVHGYVSTFRWACWQACIPVSFRGSTAGRHEDFENDHCDQSCIYVLFYCTNQLCDYFEWGHRLAPVSTGLSAPVSTIFFRVRVRVEGDSLSCPQFVGPHLTTLTRSASNFVAWHFPNHFCYWCQWWPLFYSLTLLVLMVTAVLSPFYWLMLTWELSFLLAVEGKSVSPWGQP